MPIWADPKRGERVRLLADDDLTLLATFVSPPSARPTAADLRTVPGSDLKRFATVAVRDLPGVRVTTRSAEAGALAAAGATVSRTTLYLVRDRLQEERPPLRWAAPHLAPGLDLAGVEGTEMAAISAARRRAYGDRRPRDHATQAEDDGLLHDLVANELLGPLHADASGLVLDETGGVLACLLATEWQGIGEEWKGGPWVSEVFAIPGAPPLLGRSLLARAIAVSALDGRDAIGITLTEDNPARRLVERLGFRRAFSRVTVEVPGRWPATTSPH